jgi:trk system potassium uptake protein TrkA
MRVIVVGCGRVGAELALGLSRSGHDVTVIDKTASSFNHLPAEFRGRTVEGEVPGEDVLLRAGVADADGLAAVTNLDAVNAVVAYVAQNVYHIPHVVVRNYNPQHRDLQELLGLNVVSSSSWGAQRLEELLGSTPQRPELTLGRGEIKIHQIAISDRWAGQPIDALMEAVDGVVVAVVRGGHAQLPHNVESLEAGDVIALSGTTAGVEAFRSRARQSQD